MFTLHAHSTFSLLTGTIPYERIIKLAKENGSKYAVLTDTNRMNGLIQFAKLAEEEGIKSILGTELTDPHDESLSLILLAKNDKGYSKLCKIITTRNLKESFTLAGLLHEDLSDLFIICSSIELIKSSLERIAELPNFYTELIVTENWKLKTRKLYELSQKHKIKFVASHPLYFEKQDDFILHKTVSAIRLNSTIENIDKNKLVDEEFYFKSPAELKETWKKLPEALQNVEFIADNCSVNLKFGVYKYPKFDLPEGETSYSMLWKLAFEGLKEKYNPIPDVAIKRLNKEMEVINKANFNDYFLIVWDILQEAKRREIIHVGRGSAGGSLVSYCLGISQADPIKYNLYFERFLNDARKDPPDIDLDFSWKERDEIIKYVFDKYGYSHVAMISTTVTFRARSAFRETAKAFGISEHEISKYSEFIPWSSAKNLGNLAEKFPESKSLDFSDEPWKSIVEIASKLAGFPRHISIHPSGILITPKPITNYVALEYAKNKGLGLIITQPDMYPIEYMGLIKIDLLSQRALGVLRDTIDAIAEE
ncbi:MAG: PHP domain-containing protein [Bacteroidetes bacterium]|nr:PHP domain-containing protein [Bacteroidota bacterium]MBU1114563.1 PHP domain-containing protein [Bacteroidota bacterium]MBU1800480.1 PHP domain-containing protein [Bacteroidota bacterium]